MKPLFHSKMSLIVAMAGIFAAWNVSPVAQAAPAEVEIKDENEFRKIVAQDAALEQLGTGMSFTEGPVWVPAEGGFLVFSDIPQNELKKWTPAAGITTFRKPSNNANGNTLDGQGRLISCEHSGRRVSRLEKDGALVTVVDRFEGKRFNSPNDAAIKSDGTIWFTDPDYGLGGTPREIEGLFVYRFDPGTRQLSAVVKDFDKPNGLCFSPDEKRLYVADSGKPKHIRVFEVQPDGTVEGGKVFCRIDKGGPDGIRCDAAGRVFSSAGDGIQIFSPEGELLGKILVPESPANLCFGGDDGQTLFITARKSLYSIHLLVKGAGLRNSR
jgi:gluconolactonase